MRVKPTGELQVLHPTHKRFIDRAGEDVPATTYWLRRLRDGDVELVTAEAPAAPAVPAPNPTPTEAEPQSH